MSERELRIMKYEIECVQQETNQTNKDDSSDKYMAIRAKTFYEAFYKIDKTKYGKSL